MKILGYSERGIINSLIFSIGEDKVLMDAFVMEIGINKLFESEQPKDYEILLEQSFSGFGDSDLIIIIEYKSHKKVLFIEGKVKTFNARSWSLKKQYGKYEKGKYPGYSSNLFYQLYLKSLLFKNLKNLEWEIGKNSYEYKVTNFKDVIANCGVRDRKIGGNEIVWKALKKIAACDEAFYVGLVPSSKLDNEVFNGELDYQIHFMSWDTAYAFCVKNKLNKVLEIFQYNEGQIYKSNPILRKGLL